MKEFKIALKPKSISIWVVLSYGMAHSDILFFRKKPNVKNPYFYSDDADKCIGRMGIYQFNCLYKTSLPVEYNEAKDTEWNPLWNHGDAHSLPQRVRIELPVDKDGDILQILPDIG